MVSKSLRELLNNEEKIVGIQTKIHGSKKIESPGGQVRFVPSYTVDYVAPADSTVTRVDTGKLTNNNWNMETNTRETVKLDRIFTASSREKTRKRTITNKT